MLKRRVELDRLRPRGQTKAIFIELDGEAGRRNGRLVDEVQLQHDGVRVPSERPVQLEPGLCAVQQLRLRGAHSVGAAPKKIFQAARAGTGAASVSTASAHKI